MGGALIDGFIRSGMVKPEYISVADRSAAVLERFAATGVKTFADNGECVKEADIVVLAVKPYLVETVAAEIRGKLRNDCIVVSIAAGVALDRLEACFGKHVFRAIPNIAASLGESMTFVSGPADKGMDAVQKMFDMAGRTMVIDEKLIDAAMVSASCGMAYALRYMRAAMEAGIEMGLTASDSRTIVAQTVKGASDLLLSGGLHPETLIDMVSTPGGITIAGLNEMEHKGFTSAVVSGHSAAYKKVKGK